MDHFKILKRAWQITWNYRILWVFGFLLALTTGRGGGGGGGGGGSGYRMDESDLNRIFPHGEFQIPGFTQGLQEVVGAFLTLFIVFACLGVILAIAFTIARYVSETALFRMVNQYEEDETKYTIKKGFRLGWSRAAFNLFLMNLIVGLVGFIVFALLFLIAAIPLLSWIVENDVVRTIGTVASGSFALLVIFLLILTSIVVGLVMQFARRVLVLENRGVIEAFQEGFQMVRARIGDTIIMGLILLGIGIAFAIVMIPVVLLLFSLAAILGGLPGLLAYWIASLALDGAAPYLIGIAVALPLFLLLVGIPASIIGGVFETFRSSVWTLTYREFRSLSLKTEADELSPEDLSTVLLPDSDQDLTIEEDETKGESVAPDEVDENNDDNAEPDEEGDEQVSP